jgi:hypothetical protein
MPVKPGDPPVADPQHTPPVFDPESFMTKILGEFDKRTNALDKKLTAITKSIVKEPAAADPPADPNNPPADPPANPKIADPAVNTELQALRKQIANLQKSNEESTAREKAATGARLENERQTAIRNVLNAVEFRDQESRDLVFNAVLPTVKRDDDGSLIADSANGPISFDAHVKSYAEKFPYLLAPKGGGGAGASASTGGRKAAGGPIRMSDLTPEKINALKPEEYKAMMTDILAGNITG